MERRLETEESLIRDLSALGIQSGEVLVVHSSLSSIGWVLGGAPTVVWSLLASLGDNGTLAMPAATPLCGDPGTWKDPRLSEDLLEVARRNLPVFDRHTTPTSLGAIPESFRTWPGTLRSSHPLESVCARGPVAEDVVAVHPFEFSEGEGTPFDKLHEFEARILLLGVGFNRCTALHFAETLSSRRRTTTVRFPCWRQGKREWLEVPNVADDNDAHFPVIGEKFSETGRVLQGVVGQANASLFAMTDLVEFARAYFETVLPEAGPGEASAR